MQFIRSKKNSLKQARRRQTWHHSADIPNNRHESSESEHDSLRGLMPPPPPIFTTQRGSSAVYCDEKLFEDEHFEPGEAVSFQQTPSPIQILPYIHTPKLLKTKLASIVEDIGTPPIGNISKACDR